MDNITILDQSKQIEELLHERQALNEQIASLQSQLEYLESTTVDKQSILRLEAKIRDLESRLELEQTTRHRAEVNIHVMPQMAMVNYFKAVVTLDLKD